MRLLSFVIAAIFALNLLACNNTTKARVTANTPSATQKLIEKKIDAAGGVITYQNAMSPLDGLELTFPAGAVTAPTDVTISTSTTRDPLGSLPVNLEPSGITFVQPVTVRLPYNPVMIQQGYDPKQLIVIVVEANGSAAIVPNATIDTVAHNATFPLNGFSWVDILYPQMFKLFWQPYRFVDGTPTDYAIVRVDTQIGASIFTTFDPLLTSGQGTSITMGKGTEQNCFSTAEGNVIVSHGMRMGPADFALTDQGIATLDGLRLVLMKSKKVKNLLFYQYPWGLPVRKNGLQLATMIKQRAAPNCKFTLIGFSMGGVVNRVAVEEGGIAPYVEQFITIGTPHEGGKLHNITDYLTQYGIASAIAGGTIPGLGDIIVGSPFLDDINRRYARVQPGGVPYALIAGNKRDAQGALVGHDGVVDLSSAIPSFFNVPPSRQFIANGEDHTALQANARNNGVGQYALAWIPGQNTPPTANAGTNQTVTLLHIVTLDGSQSKDQDLDPITYQWTQTSGMPVALSNATAMQPTFDPPYADTYVFSLVVNDGQTNSTPNTVTITVHGVGLNTAVYNSVSGFTNPACTYDAMNNPAYNTANPWRLISPRILVGVDGNGTRFEATVTCNISGAISPTKTVLNAYLGVARDQSAANTAGVIEILDAARGIVLGTAQATDTGIDIDCTAMVQYHVLHGNGSTFTFTLRSTSGYAVYYTSQASTGLGASLPIFRWMIR